MRGLILFCLITFFFFGSLCAQRQYGFKPYTIDNGLHHSNVSAICQDHYGYLYFGFINGGISKFDGDQFSFIHASDLKDASISDLFCTTFGEVWVASDQGLYAIKDSKIKRYSDTEGFPSRNVTCLYEDKDHQLWVGTKDHGLFLYNGSSFKHFGTDDGLRISSVSTITQSSDGLIWVGGNKNAIAYIADSKAQHITNLSSQNISCIISTTDHQLLCATDSGVFFYNTAYNRFDPFTVAGKTLNTSYHTITESKDGVLWFASDGSGLLIVDSDSVATQLNINNGLYTNFILDIFCDRDNNIWIAEDGHGLQLFLGRLFTAYNRSSGLHSNMVFDVAKNSSNELLIANRNGVEVIKQDKVIKTYNTSNTIGEVSSIFQDSQHRFWLSGMYGTGYIFQDNLYLKPLDTLTHLVNTFFQKDTHTVWIGGADGLWSFDGKQIERLYANKLPAESLNYIYQDHNSCIWLVFDNEVITLCKEVIARVSLPSQLKKFSSITQDKQNNLYLVHSTGIAVIKPDRTYSQITQAEGLTDNRIYFCSFVDGYLWVGHQKGIDKLSIDDKGAIISSQHYSKSDGFLALETKKNSFYKDPDGSYWVGTLKGAYNFSPTYDTHIPNSPSLSIVELKLHSGSIDWKSVYPDFQIESNLPLKAVFNYEHNHISFRFIGIDFKSPDNVRYQTKLEGSDTDWLPLTSLNTVSYSNLPPGKYLFRVKSISSDGVWSEEKTFEFSIKGPFWKKTWFYVIAILVGGFIIYSFMLLRTRHLSRGKKRLEEIVRERTQELAIKNRDLERLSIVARKIYDAVLICDKYGNIEWFNRSFYTMAGFSNLTDYKASVLGKLDRLQDISSNTEINDIVARLNSGNQAIQYDSYHINKNGEKCWTSGTLTPIYGHKKELINIIGVYKDITERKASELKLTEQNDRLRKLSIIAEQMNEAVFITDNTGAVEYYNYGMVRNSGYSNSEFDIIVKRLKNIQNMSSHPGIQTVVDGFKTKPDTVFYDSSHKKKDGSIMWTTASLSPVYNDDELEHIVVVYTDITKRHNIAKQLKQSNKDLTDSILYAKQIQRAVLPEKNILQQIFKSSFVFYQPRDIVSGDFYWFSQIKDFIFIAAADCTGHGVPGALMSMIGNEFLHQIINSSNIQSPGAALEALDKMIVRALHQNTDGDDSMKDGMDIAFCAIHLPTLTCQYAGAFNPLYLIREGELQVFEATKDSIGGNFSKNKHFETHNIDLKPKDRVYIFSDGYTDQFGGSNNKKFTRKRFKNLLLSLQDTPMPEQQAVLKSTFLEWKGDKRQVDDMLIIGFEIPN